MKNKSLVIVMLVVILVVILGAAMVVNNIKTEPTITNPNGNNEPSTNLVDNETTKSFDVEKRVLAKVSCPSEADSIIPTESASFEIQFEEDVSKEYVENVFSIEDATKNKNVEFEIEKVNNNFYRLNAVDSLEEGSIYTVIERTDEGAKKWAFQTKQEFKISSTSPGNNSTLSPDSSIAIYFQTPIEDYEQYVSINPAVNGYWTKNYQTTLYFRHPQENFVDNQLYKVTIKKGMKDIYGNELKEDVSFTFTCLDYKKDQKIEDMWLASENVFHINEKTSFALNGVLSYSNKNTSIPISEKKLKIYKLDSSSQYKEILKHFNENENFAKMMWTDDSYKVVLESEGIRETSIAKTDEGYSRTFQYQIDTEFSSSTSGYFVALMCVNNLYVAKPFQVNDNLSTINFMNTGEAMIVYKNVKNLNNHVDVFINNTKVGSTDSDGLLYVENLKEKVGSDYNSTFNYIEFKCDDPLIFDVTADIDYIDSSWVSFYFEDSYRDLYVYIDNERNTNIARHNNGYIYFDRPVYKAGETINIWGYARNRVYGVKSAVLKIYNDGLLVDEVNVKLNKMGCFTYEYELDEVNSESGVDAELIINDSTVSRAHSKVLNYTNSTYSVSIDQNASTLIDGETAEVKITANTFDGVPLVNANFNCTQTGGSDYIKVNTKSVATDENGEASQIISFERKSEATTTSSNYVELRYDNSLLDGGNKSIYFDIYPYKNSANMNLTFDKNTKKYTAKITEYNVKDRSIKEGIDDSISIELRAYYEEKYVKSTSFDEYTMKETKIYGYNQISVPEHDKNLELNIVNGQATIEFDNWVGENGEKAYYAVYVYINTDDGRKLQTTYYTNTSYMIYGYSYENEEVSEKDGEESGESAGFKFTKANEIPLYHLDIPTRVSKFGETIELPLVEGRLDDFGSGVNEKSTDKVDDNTYKGKEFYVLIVSGKGAKVIKEKGKMVSFKYEEEMGANIAVFPIIYDGEKIYSANYISSTLYGDYERIDKFRTNSGIAVKDSALLLDIDVKFDKETYKPGEEAVIKVKTSHDGKGVSSGVLLSAIDSAYVDSNGTSRDDIENSLYNPYRLSSYEITSHAYINSFSVEGGGGGGDGDYVRDSILTTAFFENVVTNSQGEATVKVKLPDNVTEWTVTALGISSDYRAESKVVKTIVSKDFYVALTHQDKYIEDELFAFNVKAFGKEFKGKDVILQVEILDDKGTIVERGNVTVKVGTPDYYKMSEGLKEGKYKIKLHGEINDYSDTLVEEFEVKKTLLEVKQRETLNLQNGDAINVASPKGTIYVLNQDVAKNLDLLHNLVFLRGATYRNDSRIISKQAYAIYNALLNNKDYIPTASYYDSNDIMKITKESGIDYNLILRNYATKGITNDMFQTIETDKGRNAMLWAMAAAGKPILKELRANYEKVKNNPEEFTEEEALYIALGLAELGDFEKAGELYEVLKSQVPKVDENNYVLLTILSIKINSDDREDYYNSVLEMKLPPEKINYIKLYYLQNEVNKHYKAGKLVLNIDGQDNTINVRNIGLTEINVSNKSNYYVKSMSDNVKVMLEDYKPVNVDAYESKGYISKTYSKNNPKPGETVSVTITIQNKKLVEEVGNNAYIIEDVIPNNMSFMDINNGSNGWLNHKDGQKLQFYTYTQVNNNGIPAEVKFTYNVRVASAGEQKESGTLLINFDDEIIDIIKP